MIAEQEVEYQYIGCQGALCRWYDHHSSGYHHRHRKASDGQTGGCVSLSNVM
jgi:hypothetical protein